MVDRASTRGELADAVEAAVRGGVDWVQVRERQLEGAALLALVEALGAAARRGATAAGRPVRLLVNRRVDVARVSGADGVHLGFDGMPAARARELLGPHALIGRSLHSPREAAQAEPGASYLHLAPVFPPLSKAPSQARPALGLAALSMAAAAAAGLPVLAQGGIEAGNAASALAAGAAGVAVTGAILHADAPGAAAAALREALDGA